MKKTSVFKYLAVAAALLGTAAAAVAQTWDCGETPGTVSATLSNDTLSISGAGNMRNYIDDFSDFFQNRLTKL